MRTTRIGSTVRSDERAVGYNAVIIRIETNIRGLLKKTARKHLDSNIVNPRGDCTYKRTKNFP